MGSGKAIVIAIVTSAITSAGVFFGLRELTGTQNTAVQVPSLSGLTVDQARQLLEAKQLRLAIFERRAHATQPAGKIVSQAPLASSDSTRNGVVFVVVSEGGATAPKPGSPRPPPAKATPPAAPAAPAAQMVEVPRVTWKGLRRAKKILREAGFIVGKVRYIEDEDRASGIVLRQKPAAKTQAPRGSEVILTVNDTD